MFDYFQDYNFFYYILEIFYYKIWFKFYTTIDNDNYLNYYEYPFLNDWAWLEPVNLLCTNRGLEIRQMRDSICHLFIPMEPIPRYNNIIYYNDYFFEHFYILRGSQYNALSDLTTINTPIALFKIIYHAYILIFGVRERYLSGKYLDVVAVHVTSTGRWIYMLTLVLAYRYIFKFPKYWWFWYGSNYVMNFCEYSIKLICYINNGLFSNWFIIKLFYPFHYFYKYFNTFYEKTYSLLIKIIYGFRIKKFYNINQYKEYLYLIRSSHHTFTNFFFIPFFDVFNIFTYGLVHDYIEDDHLEEEFCFHESDDDEWEFYLDHVEDAEEFIDFFFEIREVYEDMFAEYLVTSHTRQYGILVEYSSIALNIIKPILKHSLSIFFKELKKIKYVFLKSNFNKKAKTNLRWVPVRTEPVDYFMIPAHQVEFEERQRAGYIQDIIDQSPRKLSFSSFVNFNTYKNIFLIILNAFLKLYLYFNMNYRKLAAKYLYDSNSIMSLISLSSKKERLKKKKKKNKLITSFKNYKNNFLDRFGYAPKNKEKKQVEFSTSYPQRKYLRRSVQYDIRLFGFLKNYTLFSLFFNFIGFSRIFFSYSVITIIFCNIYSFINNKLLNFEYFFVNKIFNSQNLILLNNTNLENYNYILDNFYNCYIF